MRSLLKSAALAAVMVLWLGAGKSVAQPVPSLDGAGWWNFNQNGFTWRADASDEFNYSNWNGWETPDTTKWNQWHPTGWTGNDRFIYQGNLSYVHKGNLVLEARPGDKYACGIASSKSWFHYGYFEVRCLADPQNIAQSFWFFNDQQYEIDVFEHLPIGTYNEERMLSNIHHFEWTPETGNVDQIPWYGTDKPLIGDGRSILQWNTFGCMKVPGAIHFFANGKLVRTIWQSSVPVDDWPGDKWMPAIIDTLVYNWQSGADNPEDRRSFFLVDYFRVWTQ